MGLENTLEKRMTVKSFAISDQGTREYQQDAGYVETWEEGAAAVLCDGMGGLEGGEKASNLCVQLFMKDFRETQAMRDIPAFLRQEAVRLNQMVIQLKDEEGNPLDAGTTIVAAILKGNLLYWLSIGDSRLYLLRNERLCCLTKDHNYKSMLEEKMQEGRIDMDYYNAEIHQGEALTSYLGVQKLSLVDENFQGMELLEEDILLLCSDGLYKTLTEEQIQALLNESGGHLHLAGRRLIDTARRWGVKGQDNTTLVLMKLISTEQS